jgi:protein-disulfide isomerase
MARKSKRRRMKEQPETAEAPKKEVKSSRKSGPAVNQTVILAVVVIVVAAAVAWYAGSLSCTGAAVAGDAGSEVVETKVVDFLQSRLGVTYPGIEVEAVSVEDYPNMTDTYEVIVKITFQGQSQEIPYYASKDGKNLFTIIGDLDEEFVAPETEETAPQSGEQGSILRNQPENPEIQTFYDSGEDICYEDGKPVIRMYASSGCGYCKWNKPIYGNVTKEYMDAGKIVAYLWEDGKNVLSEEQEAMPAEEELLRQKYGFTGVPAFIFGCKYYRTGAAYSRAENGEVLEEAELRAVIEDLLAAQ